MNKHVFIVYYISDNSNEQVKIIQLFNFFCLLTSFFLNKNAMIYYYYYRRDKFIRIILLFVSIDKNNIN